MSIRHSRQLATALGVGALALLTFHYARYFQNASPDLLLHYLLVDEIMKYGGVRSDAANHISVMAFYPPVAHWMAAVIGWIGGSGFVGISLISVAAAFLSYTIITLLVADSAVALALFLAGFLLLAPTRSLAGWEVVTNFFYPQLVGDALYFGVLFLLVKAQRITCQTAIFIIVGALTMWVQPLNAVHIMATGCALIALEGVQLWRERGTIPTRYAVAAVAVTLISAAAIIAHPEFKVMRQISTNDGALEFGYKHIMPTVAVCAAICGSNCWQWCLRKMSRVDAVLGAAGIAACALALLQFLAWKLHGDGSPYAVKKHMFLVLTLGLLNSVRLIAAIRGGVGSRERSFALVCAPLAAAYMSTFALQGFTEPIAPTVRALAYARTVASYQFSQLKPGNTVALDETLPLLSNALISITAFNHAFDPGWWSGKKITTEAEYVMVRHTPINDENCPKRYAQNADYMLVDTPCLKAYKPGNVVSFDVVGSGLALLDNGWYATESWGTWAVGGTDSELSLTLPKNSHGVFELLIDGTAFIAPSHPSQKIDVEANGVHIATWTFTEREPEGTKTALIPEGVISNDQLRLVFKAPNAVSPRQIGVSHDGRVFGLGIRTLEMKGV